MKKLILFALVSLLIIPALAKAQTWYYCDSPLSPFKNCQVVSNFTPSQLVAGSPTCSEIKFDNKALLMFPLVIRINYTSENYEIWRNDFTGYGWVYSSSGGYNKSLVCKQPETISFFAEGYTVPNNTLYCYHEEDLFIVKPRSDNSVHVCLIPNIALIPTTFNFTEELLSTLGPIWAEPVNITIALNNTTAYTTIPLANLEIFTNFTEPIEIDALLYSNVFIQKVPGERPFSIAFLEIKTNATDEQLDKGIKIRIYYDEDYLKARGLDENNLRIYRFDVNSEDWVLLDSFVNSAENYVESNWLKSFSLFGLFTSFYYPPVQQQIIYGGGTTNYYYNVTNVTQNITQPVEKTVIEKVVEKAVCGNNICEVGESCSICPQDCKCPNGYECKEGVCLAKAVCGNGVCEKGENNVNCPEDCPAVAPTPTGGLGGVTGALVATITNPIFAGIISLIVIAIVLAVLRFKVIKKS
jgi:hypothetical protein